MTVLYGVDYCIYPKPCDLLKKLSHAHTRASAHKHTHIYMICVMLNILNINLFWADIKKTRNADV